VWTPLAESVVLQLIADLPANGSNPVGTHAVRLGALPIGASMWAEYYLRPNGVVVVVGEDFDHPDVDSVYRDRNRLLRMLVWGLRRYPELKRLLPVRGPDAIDCGCRKVRTYVEGHRICHTCNGLGWLPVTTG